MVQLEPPKATLRRSKNYVNLSLPIDEEGEQVSSDLLTSSRQADSADQQHEGYCYVDFSQHDHYENENEADQNAQADTKLSILRDLLAIERQQNQQRRLNNQAIQTYVNKLQQDYLDLQRKLVDTLEQAQQAKSRKEAQLENLSEVVRDKDVLIERLKERLDNLDESKIREEFQNTLARQNQLFQLEKQQLRKQLHLAEERLSEEHDRYDNNVKHHNDQLQDLKQKHQLELELLVQDNKSKQSEIDKLLNEPANLVIRSLKEEKSRLEFELDDLSNTVKESKHRYESMKNRVEDLLEEHEAMKSKSHEELERLEKLHIEQRHEVKELKLKLQDKEEVIQIVQFNLQRSEKRVKSLVTSLKGEQSTCKHMISEQQISHQREVESLSLQNKSLEKKSIELLNELDIKQNEIIRLELEHANQMESLKTDRDQRLQKLVQEKQKLERAVQGTEIKIAREIQEKEQLVALVDSLKKDVTQFKSESKRMSIELTKSEAKMFSMQTEMKQLKDRFRNSALLLPVQEHELTLELEAEKRRSKMYSETIDELRCDCDKLTVKLKISESNLSKAAANLKQEQSLLLKEYEKKMEQLRTYQSVYDNTRIKYRRYGQKLRKYCEHLRTVHRHLCSPSLCGYSLGAF